MPFALTSVNLCAHEVKPFFSRGEAFFIVRKNYESRPFAPVDEFALKINRLLM